MDEVVEVKEVNDQDIADQILKDMKVHDMEVKGKGTFKMLSVAFLKDGTEQAIQTTAQSFVDFQKDKHFQELKSKLNNFIENRPNSIISRKPNG